MLPTAAVADAAESAWEIDVGLNGPAAELDWNSNAIQDVSCTIDGVCLAVGRMIVDSFARPIVVRSIDAGRTWEGLAVADGWVQADRVECTTTSCLVGGQKGGDCWGSLAAALRVVGPATGVWTDASLPRVHCDQFVSGIACTSDTHCFATVTGMGVTYVYVTWDGGLSWTEESPPWGTAYAGISCSRGGPCSAAVRFSTFGEVQMFEAAAVYVLASEDATWVRAELEEPVAGMGHLQCPSSDRCIAGARLFVEYVGAGETVLLESSDRGASWTVAPPIDPTRYLSFSPTGLTCYGAGRCVATFSDGWNSAALATTMDAGLTWNTEYMDGIANAVDCDGQFRCVAVGGDRKSEPGPYRTALVARHQTPIPWPGTPTAVSAVPGDSVIEVSWVPPAYDGDAPVDEVTAMASPGGASCSAVPPETSCVIDGLLNGNAYSVSVVASSTAGSSYPTAPVGPVTLSVACGDGAPGPFSDVSAQHLFCLHIEWAVAAGLVQGYQDGTFGPQVSLSRLAMAAVLYRLSGSPEFTAPETASFTDVAVGSLLFAEVEWLAAQGIATGYSSGAFGPSLPITRQALAVLLYRLSGSPEFTAPETATFTDVAVGSTFFAEVEWLASLGVIKGYLDGGFHPTAPVTRQAAAAMLHRYTLTQT